MTHAERELRKLLRNNVDSFEGGRNNADEPTMQSQILQAGKGNPPFDAQFDLQILVKYFSVSAGAFTARTAAYMLANAPTLATDSSLAFFTFGLNDFNSGFKKLRGQAPLPVWAYANPFFYGPGQYTITPFGVLDATALAQLQLGDQVIVCSATVSSVNYIALVIVRSPNVGYGTIFSALYSDQFVMNRLRYIQNDTSAAGLTQYNNAINWINLSLFGKMATDNVTVTSMKSPDQFQAGIIDLNFQKNMNKETAFWSYLNYDAVNLQWSFFVQTVAKPPLVQ